MHTQELMLRVYPDEQEVQKDNELHVAQPKKHEGQEPNCPDKLKKWPEIQVEQLLRFVHFVHCEGQLSQVPVLLLANHPSKHEE